MCLSLRNNFILSKKRVCCVFLLSPCTHLSLKHLWASIPTVFLGLWFDYWRLFLACLSHLSCKPVPLPLIHSVLLTTLHSLMGHSQSSKSALLCSPSPCPKPNRLGTPLRMPLVFAVWVSNTTGSILVADLLPNIPDCHPGEMEEASYRLLD